jgi:sulfur carrier protein
LDDRRKGIANREQGAGNRPVTCSLFSEINVITIYLNGEPRDVPEGITLAGILKWLEFPEDRIAVERNLEIVARADWDKTPVSAGDRLEVVHFVGGGGL